MIVRALVMNAKGSGVGKIAAVMGRPALPSAGLVPEVLPIAGLGIDSVRTPVQAPGDPRF